mmetsp:Transcript_28529/g.68664  ORF Transcript_28529/g.68664 Transcript_28529/m.68664 type:complete len:300 (-) Transcript_28529:359-1258(-)
MEMDGVDFAPGDDSGVFVFVVAWLLQLATPSLSFSFCNIVEVALSTAPSFFSISPPLSSSLATTSSSSPTLIENMALISPAPSSLPSSSFGRSNDSFSPLSNSPSSFSSNNTETIPSSLLLFAGASSSLLSASDAAPPSLSFSSANVLPFPMNASLRTLVRGVFMAHMGEILAKLTSSFWLSNMVFCPPSPLTHSCCIRADRSPGVTGVMAVAAGGGGGSVSSLFSSGVPGATSSSSSITNAASFPSTSLSFFPPFSLLGTFPPMIESHISRCRLSSSSSNTSCGAGHVLLNSSCTSVS